MNKYSRIFILAVCVPLIAFACSAQGLRWPAIQPLSGPTMLEPGDQIGSMVITTGSRDAAPLWVFCSPAEHTGNTATSVCNVPLIPRLALGHIFMPGDDALTRLDWSEITWELTIDDQPVDLESFGTYEFVFPALSHDPTPVREVFMKLTAWDVVLTNLDPGDHTIHGMAQRGNESYNWIIYLSIEGNDPGTNARSMSL